MLRILCLALLSGYSWLCCAQVATYTFTSGPSETPSVPSLTFTAFSRTGLGASTAAGAFNSSGFTANTSVDLNAYVEFTVTVHSGYSLTLTNMAFGSQRSGQGPASACVAYGSSGNFTSRVSPVFTPPASIAATAWDFPDTTVSNGGSVVFRFYGWSATSSSGTLRFDNVELFGSVVPASAPSCASPSGIVVSGITPTSGNISWQPVTGASGYGYALTGSATPPSVFTYTNATSYHPASLVKNTTYYVHLRSYCAADSSAVVSQSFLTPDTAGSTRELRLMCYNLLNYPGSTAAIREPKYRTTVTSYNPDILVVQEVSNPSGISSFLSNVLNVTTADYSAGTFIDGPDSDNAIFYKTGKFQFIGNTPVATALRDISEFKLRVMESGDTLIIYSVHLKASNGASDQAARAAETDSLRKRTNALGAGKYFMVCGDFNIYSGSEQCYLNMIQAGANANGKFNDIITMSGSWQSASNAIHHTQSPRTTQFGGGAIGGMDDRFDMILFSDAIVQAGGVDIKPNSYAAYGNDGLHHNQALNTAPFNMYSQAVMEAIHDGSDHVPVVVTLTYQTPVPVKLLSFDAMQKKTGNELAWITASENNSSYFAVERSTDLKQWIETGRVKAAGTSGTKRRYQFTDQHTATGIYYRLKQVDMDGRYEYSDPVAVQAGQESLRASVSPNPVTGKSQLSYYSEGGTVSITICDGMGNRVFTGSGPENAGLNRFPVPELDAGAYFVIVEEGVNRQVVKIVVH